MESAKAVLTQATWEIQRTSSPPKNMPLLLLPCINHKKIANEKDQRLLCTGRQLRWNEHLLRTSRLPRSAPRLPTPKKNRKPRCSLLTSRLFSKPKSAGVSGENPVLSAYPTHGYQSSTTNHLASTHRPSTQQDVLAK